MPSVSGKQHRLMALVANDPAAAKRLGIPQRVGEDFMKADTGRKFAKGGDMAESKKMVGKEISFMKKKGAPKSMIKHEMSEMTGMKKGGGVKKYAMGGGPLMSKGMTTAKMGAVKTGAPSRDGIATKGKTKGTMIKMSKGGKAYGGKC